MATTPEGEVKAEIKLILKKFGNDVYWNMAVPSGFGTSTLDFLVCLRGKFIAIEAKATPADKPTRLQSDTARRIVAAGGVALRVDSSNVKFLYSHLLLIAPNPHHNGTYV